jgi:hypothetical protein
MRNQTFKWIFIGLFVVFAIGAIGVLLLYVIGVGGYSVLQRVNVEAFSPDTPEGVVSDFYTWYSEYPGNPLVERAYHTSEHLSDDLIQKMDNVLDSMDMPGYDPFLCAQDIAQKFVVTDGVTHGGISTVFVTALWNPGKEFESTQELEIHLRQEDGKWRITEIRCDGSEYSYTHVTVPRAAVQTPSDVVRSFYDWYLEYIGDPASGEMHNPLVDQAYRSCGYLTNDFVVEVDALIQRNHDKYGFIPSDPFLCAQDIPEYVEVGDQPRTGSQASVVVSSNFSNHTFIVELEQVNDEWKICNIHCSGSDSTYPLPEGPIPTTPEGAVNGFYAWYLWYAKEQGNPLMDRVYRESEYLAGTFIQKVDGFLLSSSNRGGYDPFLCAQDIPQYYSFDEPLISGDTARMKIQTDFEGHVFTVLLQQINHRWVITDVLCEGGE